MALTTLDIRYQNNFGQALCFSERGSIYNDDTDILEYKWDVTMSDAPLSNGGKVTRFRKGYVEKRVPVQIYARSKDEYHKKLLRIQEVTEQDIAAEKPGRLYVNDDFASAYMIGYAPESWNQGINYQVATLTFLLLENSWYTEKKTEFVPGESEQDLSDVMTFPHAFPATFTKTRNEQYIVNDHFQPAAAKIVIYGSATNPAISIQNTIYTVEDALILNEYLVIDGLTKEVYKITGSGERFNLFNKRGKEYSVFTPIDPGKHQVISAESMRFDIMLYQKRSTPKWI